MGINVEMPDGTIIQDVPEGVSQEELTRRLQGLKQTNPVGGLMVGTGQNPDQYAQARKDGKQLGVPAELVSGNLDLMGQADLERKLNSVEGKPTLSAFVGDPNNAAVAHDDLGPLGMLESAIQTGVGIYHGLKGGILKGTFATPIQGLGEGYQAATNSLGTALGPVGDALKSVELPWFLNPGSVLKRGGQALETVIDWTGNVDPKQKGFVTDVAEGVGQLVGQIGLSIATAGTTGGAVLMGGLLAGGGMKQQADMADKAGASQGQKDMSVILGGIITGVTEKYGLDAILNRVPPAIKNGMLRAVADITVAGTIEAAQEIAENFLHNLLAKVTYDPKQSLTEGMVDDAMTAGTAAGVVRAVVVGALGGRRFAQMKVEQERTDQVRAVFDALAQGSQDSKLRGRLPEAFRDFIDKATADGPVSTVYMPADRFVELFQSAGMNPAQVAESLPGVGSAALTEAVARNGELEIPMSSFAAHMTEAKIYSLIAKDIKLSPDQLTQNQLEDMMNDPKFKEVVDRLVKANTQQNENVVYNDVYSQLVAAGRSETEADFAAKKWASRMETRAADRGMAVPDLWKEERIQIIGPQAQELRQVGDLDVILERMRSQIADEQAQAQLDPQAADYSTADLKRELDAMPEDDPNREALQKEIDLRTRRKRPTEGKFENAAKELRSILEGRGIDPATVDTQTAQSVLDNILGNVQVTTDGAEFEQDQEQQALDAKASKNLLIDVIQRGRNLVVVHNMRAAGVLHADKMGGLAVPSVAIINKDTGFDGFGDITLVGKPSMVDPALNTAAKTFDADVYSPRYPTVAYEIDHKKWNKLEPDLQRIANEIGEVLSLDEVESRGLTGITSSKIWKAYFLEKQGKMPAIAKDENGRVDRLKASDAIDAAIGKSEEKFAAWADEMLKDIVTRERIFDGFTASGNRRYLPHNLDNVVKILKRELRGGESFNYGVGSIRAHYAKMFRSLKAIQDKRGNLVSHEAMKAFKDEIAKDFDTLAAHMEDKYKFQKGMRFYDDFSSVLGEMAKRGRTPLLEIFDNLTSEDYAEIDAFIEKLRNAPTEYFESKIQRTVKLNEFYGAVVPVGTSKAVINVLKKSGLKIAEYKSGDKADRIRALNEVGQEEESLFFQSAWHGSPHIFSNFDLSKIGTGEGNQAYGWGLYFASLKEIAQHYRSRLTDGADPRAFVSEIIHSLNAGRDKLVKSGIAYYDISADTIGLEFRKYSELNSISDDAQIQNLAAIAANGYDIKTNTYTTEGIEALRKLDKLLPEPAKGRLYKVEIPDDGQYLLWDKPLSEQPEAVRDVIMDMGADRPPVLKKIYNDIGKVILPTLEKDGFDVGNFRNKIEKSIEGESPVDFSEAVRELKKEAKDFYGNRYLPDAVEDAFYEIEDAINGDVSASGSSGIWNLKDDPTGQDIYRAFEQSVGSAKAASLALRDAGIAGIKYLDGTSRSKGEGSFNYVLFDDSAVQIVDYEQSQSLSGKKYPLAPRSEWHGDGDYKSRGGEIVYMSPDEYLSQVRPLEIDDVSRENIDDLKTHINAGRTLDPLLIRQDGKEDGRHRAYAAKELGITEVPVIVFGDALQRNNEKPRTPTQSSANLGSFNQGEARGSVRFTDFGALVKLGKSADRSTFLHESGHIYLEQLLADLADSRLTPEARARIEKDVATVSAWFAANSKSAYAELKATLANTAPGTSRHALLTQALMVVDSAGGADGMKLFAQTMGSNITDPALRAAIMIPFHEMWARSYEQYLFEGKAPSEELKGAFARFSLWLKKIYGEVKAIGGMLTDDIRSVMDRMVAAHDAIDKSSAAYQIPPELFENLTPAEQAKLRQAMAQVDEDAKAELTRKLLTEVDRQKKAEWKEEYAKVEAEKQAEVEQRPVYRAMALMLEGGQKLNRDRLVADFGPEILKMLPRGITQKEGGIELDDLAGQLGYSSGDALRLELMNFRPLKDVVKEMTDAEMKARHGDLMDNIAEEAVSAVENSKTKLIEMQLTMLRRLAGGLLKKGAERAARADGVTSTAVEDKAAVVDATLEGQLNDKATPADLAAQVKAEQTKSANTTERTAQKRDKAKVLSILRNMDLPAIKLAAQKIIAAKQVKDLSPSTYRATADNLARKAMLAIAERDYESATALKEQQLLNIYMAREAEREKKKIDKALTKFGKLHKSDKKLSNVTDIDFVYAARAVLSQYNIVGAEYTFDFDRWVKLLAETDLPKAREILDLIAGMTVRPRDYKVLTVDQFRDLADLADALLIMGRNAKSIEIGDKRIARQEAVGELVAQMADQPARKVPTDKDKRERQGGVMGIVARLRRVEHWTRMMDGGKSGPFNTYIVQPVMDALTIYRDAKAEQVRKLRDIVKPIQKGLLKGPIAAPELGAGFTFNTKAELLHAILHTGNEGNMKRLILGYKWGVPQADGVDRRQWDAFMARMYASKTITKEDMDAVQKIWDLLEGTKGAVQRAHKKMKGYYFKEVEAWPVLTPFGTYRGGYVPAIYSSENPDQSMMKDAESLMEGQNAAMFPSVARGFTKGRAENYSGQLELDLMLLAVHLDKVMRFAHLGPAIQTVASVVNDREFKGNLHAVDVSAVDELLWPWLQRTAQQSVYTPSTGKGGRYLDRFFNGLRGRVGLHTMALNVANAAQQIVSIPAAGVVVGYGRLLQALAAVSASPFKMAADISAQSDFMRQRLDDSQRDIQRELKYVLERQNILQKSNEVAGKYGYILQQTVQNWVDKTVWLAAYNKAAATMSHDLAVAEADSVVRRTQGSFNPEDLSLAETGSAGVRLFTMFSSYFNTNLNLVASEAKIAKQTKKSVSRGARYLHLYIGLIMVPAVLAEAIAKGFKGELGDEDEDGFIIDDLLKLFFVSQIKFLAAMVPFAGQAISAGINMVQNDKPFDDKISPSPVVSAADAVVRTVMTPIGQLVANDATTAWEKMGSSRYVKDVLMTIGLITGIPLGQVGKSAGYILDVKEGKQTPQNGLDVVQGLVSGFDGSQKK